MQPGFKNLEFYKECMGSLALLPPRYLVVLKVNFSFNITPKELKIHYVPSFTCSLTVSSMMPQQSRMLMRQNVNNDVSNNRPIDSFHECCAVGHTSLAKTRPLHCISHRNTFRIRFRQTQKHCTSFMDVGLTNQVDCYIFLYFLCLD